MYTGPKPTLDKPITIPRLQAMKDAGEKIACLTAYDASFSTVLGDNGVEIILVGDSLGMVIQGKSSTVPVTTDEIVYHCKATAAGLNKSFLLADMPFLSYSDREVAMRNAARLMQEGDAHMVKLEGGVLQADVVEFLSTRGVPVCGHIGLRPQQVHKLGGYRVQGKQPADAEEMLEDARVLEEAGADLLLVECVPSALGKQLAEQSRVPVIGIGAGPDTDGQILVLQDMLGITSGHKARFVQNFLNGEEGAASTIPDAVAAYVNAVKTGTYPQPEHCF